VRTRWIPAIGHLQMSELYARPEYILEAQTNWRTNGVEVRNRRRRPRRIIPSDVTLHHYRAKLNKAFAENRRLHNNQVPNPAEAAGDVPPLEPKEIITLTREEARSLQAVAAGSDDIRTLHMGMRPAELLGLRRRDIDWNNGFVQVGRPSLNSASAAWEDHNLVFTNPIGRPVNPQWLRAHFRQLLEQARITQVTMHGLQHTHVIPTMRAGTAARVDRLLGTRSNRPGSDASEPAGDARSAAESVDRRGLPTSH
jgi:integrase